jgi:hypothetical protein
MRFTILFISYLQTNEKGQSSLQNEIHDFSLETGLIVANNFRGLEPEAMTRFILVKQIFIGEEE